MLAVKTTNLILGAAFVCCCVAGCGKSTSKSSSNEAAVKASSQKETPTNSQTPAVTNPTPLTIDADNVHSVASNTLSTVILGDISLSALDNAAYTSGNSFFKAANLPTGVVINLYDIPCAQSGNFDIHSELTDSSNAVQINFQDKLNLVNLTAFDACDQGVVAIDGDVQFNFHMDFSEIIDFNRYNVETTIWSNALDIRSFYHNYNVPFRLAGFFNFIVNSDTAGNVTSHITSDSSVFYSDQAFEQNYFEAVKQFNIHTWEYNLYTSGQLIHSAETLNFTEYQTDAPLNGVGLAPPRSGHMTIFGNNETLYVEVIDQQSVLLELDQGNDGTIDYEEYSTWENLVLIRLSGPQQ